MRNHRRIGVLLAWLLCFVVASVALSQTARAGGSAPPSTVFLRHLLPGLGENARQFQAFGNQPTAGNSAGLAARRADLTRQAKQAYDDQDWPNASSLYRKRLRLGDENHPSLWLALATASSRRKTADARTVETAAFIAYELNETHGADATTAKRALLLIAKGLRLQNNNLARIDLLAAMRRAYPDDDLIKHELAEASKTFGIRVRKLTVHANRFPTSACIAFNVKLGSAPDFHPADWVIFTPPVKGAAITEQNGDLCIDGLPAGHTTRVILRAGLPLQAGTTLPSETKIPVAIRDRRAQLIADVGHYLIPASSPSTIGISTVNLDKVRLKIVRIASCLPSF